MNIYESLIKGLQEAVEFEKGNISLKTSTYTIAEIEELSAKDIKQIRQKTGLSQVAFASAIGVTKKAVEAWESGRNKPLGPARRLLLLVEENPMFFEENNIIERTEPAETIDTVIHSRSEDIQTSKYQTKELCRPVYALEV